MSSVQGKRSTTKSRVHRQTEECPVVELLLSSSRATDLAGAGVEGVPVVAGARHCRRDDKVAD